MIPWVQIDEAALPGSTNTLRLKQRGDEFSIMLGSNELMNSRLSGSEQALATLACTRMENIAKPRILIGGLGMGFTLRAALEALGPDAHIDVAELVPAVIAWARGPMQSVFHQCLDDPRVHLLETDVQAPIKHSKAVYDAILLDVDNGPDGLTHEDNSGLYAESGLGTAVRALRRGGVLAVWSSGSDAGFTRRLKRAGFAVEEVKTRARGSRGGARHVIWLATKTTQKQNRA